VDTPPPTLPHWSGCANGWMLREAEADSTMLAELRALRSKAAKVREDLAAMQDLSATVKQLKTASDVAPQLVAEVEQRDITIKALLAEVEKLKAAPAVAADGERKCNCTDAAVEGERNPKHIRTSMGAEAHDKELGGTSETSEFVT
jgi:hypothetical protein